MKMMKNRKIFLHVLASATFCFPLSGFAVTESFQSVEHVLSGRAVKLYFTADKPLSADYQLTLPNGLKLTYAEIITLSGDFYAVLGKPVSGAQTVADENSRFQDSFDSLARDAAAAAEVPKVLDILHEQEKELQEGLAAGMSSEAVFKQMGDRYERRWNCLTGGGCGSDWFLRPGRYLKLAEDDFDHFGTDAVKTYRAGHRMAVEMAARAHAKADLPTLELAYAMNAYACHFLSDHFSAGHLRTPRRALPAEVSPSLVGSALVTYMHQEENQFGLRVHNAQGDRWFLMGDGYYLSNGNSENRKQLIRALQRSADEIAQAFLTGVAVEGDVTDLIPEADETGFSGMQDIAPLFYKHEKNILRRKDMRDRYDRRGTTSWWGWTTLSQLAKDRGIPTSVREILSRPELRREAVKQGLVAEGASQT